MTAPDRPSRPNAALRAVVRRRVDHRPRLALAVALTVLTYALFPAVPATNFPVYDVGSVASDNVIAPFAFRVMKDAAELSREREALAQTVQPVYAFVPSALDTAQQQLRAFAGALDSAYVAARGDSVPIQRAAAAFHVALSARDVSYLADAGRRRRMIGAVVQAYGRWLSAGVAEQGALNGVSGEVVFRRGSTERPRSPDSLRTFGEFVVQARALQPDAGPLGSALYERLLQAFFHPTIVADSATT
ncbi:MAG: hypothetical protein ACRENQ_00665, partial [Gemmatimonadaceae bacterium]